MDAKSGIDVGLLMRVVEDVFFTEYFIAQGDAGGSKILSNVLALR